MISVTRRDFISAAATLSGTLALGATRANPPAAQQIKAIAFDAFPIFDVRPVFKLAEDMFPGKGSELSNEWRTRQFEYCWLRALSNQYADFWQIASDSLTFAATKLKIALAPTQRDQLLDAYLRLQPWPEVPAVLKTLRASGYRLGFLSNFTPKMLDSNIRSANLEGLFEHSISTDEAHSYKPATKAYQLGVDRFKLDREQILFVAFAGWDAAGAKAFGFPTCWINRMNQPPELLDQTPDATGNSLDTVTQFLASH